MPNKTYPEKLRTFENIVRDKVKDKTIACLIIDSPWMPGYAQIDTIDFYFDSRLWFDAYLQVHNDFPDIVFIPDMWVEFGMGAEPSAWGVQIEWSHVSPPSIHGYPGGLQGLLDADVPDPEKHGLMPVILGQYERMGPVLKERGYRPLLAAARGPLAVASHLIGVTNLLLSTKLEPENCLKLLEKTTELCIRWLRSQLQRIEQPLGILVLDDVVGMMGPQDAETFAFPFLKRIFDSFPELIHFFHNDTPNENVYPGLSTVGMDAFNLTHEVDIVRARELLGPDIVLMGNIPPIDVLVNGTKDEVTKATEALLQKLGECGPLLISPGGGVSPGTPVENLKTMVEVVQSW